MLNNQSLKTGDSVSSNSVQSNLQLNFLQPAICLLSRISDQKNADFKNNCHNLEQIKGDSHLTTPTQKNNMKNTTKTTNYTFDGSISSPRTLESPGFTCFSDLTTTLDKPSKKRNSRSPPFQVNQLQKESQFEEFLRTPKKNKKLEDYEGKAYFRDAPRKHNNSPESYSPTSIQFSRLNDF